MTQLMNQFVQSVEKGLLDLRLNPNTISCEVHSSQVTPLLPGQAVKIYDDAGGVPKVVACSVDTDKIFGIVALSIKDQSFPALSALEIASENNVIYMQSSAAIARGAKVMYVVSGEKIATSTNGKSVVGFAFDKATAADQFIRVYLQPFSSAAIAGQAADVGAMGATTNLSALVPAAVDVGASFVQATINAAFLTKCDNVDAETLRTEVEARLDAHDAKLDGFRTALRSAGLMA